MLKTKSKQNYDYLGNEIIGFDKELEYLKQLGILIDKYLTTYSPEYNVLEEIRYLINVLNTNLGESERVQIQRKIINSVERRRKLIARIKEIKYDI